MAPWSHDGVKIRDIFRAIGVIVALAVAPAAAQKTRTTDPLIGFDAWVTACLIDAVEIPFEPQLPHQVFTRK